MYLCLRNVVTPKGATMNERYNETILVIMKKGTVIAALLLMAAGVQVAWAQAMRVNLTGNRSVLYDVSEVESVVFSENTIAEGFEYVDLGLPSGTLWATTNIGASKPEAAGDYFAWAETQPKDSYSWSTYKYGTEATNLKRYTTSNTNYGRADYILSLLPEDDAANAIWGKGWEMPSQKQFEELVDANYTTAEWTTLNDVSGVLITSNQNGRTLFLPAAGQKASSEVHSEGTYGMYWTRGLLASSGSTSGMANNMRLSSSLRRIASSNRSYGLSIRPVRVQEKNKVREFVDLGLPSGTLWATCNVGANSPGERGDYFAWGETVTKDTYTWETYSFYNGSTESMSKYNLRDGKMQLDEEDDAATVCWGEDWQMPSKEQMQELIDNTNKYWTLQDGAYGLLMKSKTNSSSIFLPLTNYARIDPELPMSLGFYWVRDAQELATANGIVYSLDDIRTGEFSRYYNHCVRPVRTNPHSTVDLGLPSGTLWAACNIGADNPEEAGDYFAWGETEPKKTYRWENYKFYGGFNDEALVNTVTKYNLYEGWGEVDGKRELDPEDDAATVNWGELWQMPSMEQFEELINPEYTTSSWTTINNVKVRKITSKKNSNSIYLPAAGLMGPTLMNDGSQGLYWSRMLHTGNPTSARYLTFYTTSDIYDTGYGLLRTQGLPVRPVRKK